MLEQQCYECSMHVDLTRCMWKPIHIQRLRTHLDPDFSVDPIFLLSFAHFPAVHSLESTKLLITKFMRKVGQPTRRMIHRHNQETEQWQNCHNACLKFRDTWIVFAISAQVLIKQCFCKIHWISKEGNCNIPTKKEVARKALCNVKETSIIKKIENT